MSGDAAEVGLIRRARQGDRAAFDELMTRYQRPVYGFVYRLVGDRDDAAEVTQEAFVRAWRFLGRFDPARPFRPWLYAIAANRAASRRERDKKRETVGLDEAGAEPVATDNPHGELAREELSAEVQAAIRQLSRQQREAIVLVELEDLTAAEAGEVMGIEAVTVRQHVFRGKKRLRELLAAYVERGVAEAEER